MPRYKYTYYINNVVVDRKTFEEELQEACIKCDTNYSNPLLNIGYVDTKKYERTYRQLKTQKINCFMVCNAFGGRGYSIKREVKQNA